MRAVTFGDPNAFLDALRPLIISQPARCTTLNTVLHNHVAAPFSAEEPIMAAVLDDSGALVAAALQTPPYPLTVVIDSRTGHDMTVVATLAGAVRRRTTAFTAISGPAVDIDAFAAAWFDLTGAGSIKSKALLLHRLGIFAPPRGVVGCVREASPVSASDSELIALWWYRFALEARTSPRPSAPNPDVLAQRSTRRHATLLWCVDGRPVAVAGAGSVVDGAVRIGPVYTPPAERGHHYGSAVTAAAVESALRRGASVVELFTDADYPTSNNIYRRLGFEQVDVFEEVDVTPIRHHTNSVSKDSGWQDPVSQQ